MWKTDAQDIIDWHFYVHDNNGVEFVKTPKIVNFADRQMIESNITTLATYLKNSDINTMNCCSILESDQEEEEKKKEEKK